MTDLSHKERRAKMLERVRKLMSMARDGNSEHEQEIALRRANSLMAEFGIAEAECDISAIEADEMVFGECKVGADGKDVSKGRKFKRTPVWTGVLAVGVARFTETVIARVSAEREDGSYGQVFIYKGEKEDVLLAKWLFGALLYAIQSAQKASGFSSRREAGAFRLGAASALAARLRALVIERQAMYEKAQREAGSRALVVVHLKKEKVSKMFGKLHTRHISSSSGNVGATHAGVDAGNRITIPSGRPLEGGITRRLT